MSRGPIPDFPRDRPTRADVRPVIAAIYGRPDGGTGCCLHIALDDGNLTDDNLRFCGLWAIEAMHADCLFVSLSMLRMTSTQRRRLSRGK